MCPKGRRELLKELGFSSPPHSIPGRVRLRFILKCLVGIPMIFVEQTVVLCIKKGDGLASLIESIVRRCEFNELEPQVTWSACLVGDVSRALGSVELKVTRSRRIAFLGPGWCWGRLHRKEAGICPEPRNMQSAERSREG